MVKVEMPRGNWEHVLMVLEQYKDRGYLVGYLIKDIENQVYSQEY